MSSKNGVMFMLHLFAGIDLSTGLLLVVALLFVLFYEAINGFHDTANAVATVIYTRAMRAQLAVAMAGIFNFLGVLLGGLSVAYAIVHMLPTDLLLNVGSAHGLAMVFSMLLAAIIWNLVFWLTGLQLTYADRCHYRYRLDQCVGNGWIVGGCAKYS